MQNWDYNSSLGPYQDVPWRAPGPLAHPPSTRPGRVLLLDTVSMDITKHSFPHVVRGSGVHYHYLLQVRV
ncbi:unnamed protein product [Gadus morhua 'NCC']